MSLQNIAGQLLTQVSAIGAWPVWFSVFLNEKKTFHYKVVCSKAICTSQKALEIVFFICPDWNDFFKILYYWRG